MDLTIWPLTLSDNPNASRWVDSSLKYVERLKYITHQHFEKKKQQHKKPPKQTPGVEVTRNQFFAFVSK